MKLAEIIAIAERRCREEVIIPRAEQRMRQARLLAAGGPAHRSPTVRQRLSAWLTHAAPRHQFHRQPR